MKKFFRQTLAAALIVTGLSATAYAQQGATSAPQSAPAQSTPMKKGLCASERHNVWSSCRNKPCTPGCLEAHEAMKACRARNNLPPPRPNPNRKTPPCTATGSANSGTQNTPSTSP